jgi:hypothetical protein
LRLIIITLIIGGYFWLRLRDEDAILLEAVVGSGTEGIDDVLKWISFMNHLAFASGGLLDGVTKGADRCWRLRGEPKEQLKTYLPARGPVVARQLVILDSELVYLGVGVPSGISRDNTILAILSTQIIGGKLDHCKASLEFTILTWRPVNTNIEIDTTVVDTVVSLDVCVVLLGQCGDLALSAMVQFLVDEVENVYLVLVGLFERYYQLRLLECERVTPPLCIGSCDAPANRSHGMEMEVTRRRRKSTYLGSIIICLEEELFVTVGRLIELLRSVGVTIHASQNLVGSDDCCSGFRLVDLLVTCHGDRVSMPNVVVLRG